MLEFTYRFDPASGIVSREHSRDFGAATRADLLWHYFPGDIGVRSNGEGFETHYGWVPLLHFTLSIVEVCRQLMAASMVSVEYAFTEMDEVLSFIRSGDSIAVKCSFDPAILECPLSQFVYAVKEYSSGITAKLCSEYPSLAVNPLMAEIDSRSGLL